MGVIREYIKIFADNRCVATYIYHFLYAVADLLLPVGQGQQMC